MKKIAILTLFTLLFVKGFSQSGGNQQMFVREADTSYTLKKYYICYLKTGPNRNQSEKEAELIQAMHQMHITALVRKGKVQIAGPMDEEGDIKGILVFGNVADADEVKRLEGEDPAVKAGRLVMDIHPWWAGRGSCLK